MTEQEMRALAEMVRRDHLALFGDKENGQPGIVDKIDMMFNVFNGTKFAGKLVLGVIVTFGALALAFTQFGTFVKHIFAWINAMNQ